MMPAAGLEDLIVLAADLSMQAALKEILKRHHSLRIRKLSYTVIQEPNHDSGVLRSGHKLLQAQSRLYRHALALCDRHGCGREALSREQLETLIETELANHWGDRAAAVVIDPELESWVWADSRHVALTIGWHGGMPAVRQWPAYTPASTRPS
jgi:hypothetical protein